MAHTVCCYKDMLIVYGGMDQAKKALHEIAVLKFGCNVTDAQGAITRSTSKTETVGTARLHCACEHCGHQSGLCELPMSFPEASTLNANFHLRVQVPAALLEKLVNEYSSEFFALLRVFELLGNRVVEVRTLGKVWLRGGCVVKNVPVREELLMCRMQSGANDATLGIRREKLDSWGPVLDQECLVLEIYNKDLEFSPSELVGVSSGYSRKNLLVPLLRLSETVVFISRTAEYLSMCLFEKRGRVFFIVLDNNYSAVYPKEQLFQPNLKEILARSHLSISGIFASKDGTSIYIYPAGLTEMGGEIYSRELPLSAVLSYSSYKPSFTQEFEINSKKIPFFHIENIDKVTATGVPNVRIYRTDEIAYFSLMIYHKNRLIHWEEAPPRDNKRLRHQGSTKIVKISDSRILSKTTGLFEWNNYSKQLFHMIASPS